MVSCAEQLAELLSFDPQCWSTESGVEFDEIASHLGGQLFYASCAGFDNDGHPLWKDVDRQIWCNGNPVRYEFPDQSAVVFTEDAWDVEGEARYSWSGVSGASELAEHFLRDSVSLKQRIALAGLLGRPIPVLACLSEPCIRNTSDVNATFPMDRGVTDLAAAGSISRIS